MPSLLSFHDQQHITRMFVQEQRVNAIFNHFISTISPEMRKWKDSGHNSVWVRNSSIEKAIEKRLNELKSNLENEIKSGQTSAWNEAVLKNDKIVEQYIKGMSLSSTAKQGMFKRNLDALEALQNRIDNGLDLSQRVWKIAEQTKGHIELFLESGIATGRSAEQIGRDFRQLLNEPNKRFRRVRNEDGKLVLSQPMKDYHSGRGVYRSAKMNAIRVSATETNMAYRVSDSERWRQLDFVTGYEVKRSQNGHPCDICDPLAGKYPKDFIFSGWHPFCICIAVPIVLNHDDFADYLLTDQIPADKYVQDIPPKAREWIDEYLKKHPDTPPLFYKINQDFYRGNRQNIQTIKNKINAQKKQQEQKTFISFEPFSPIIIEHINKLKTNNERQKLLYEVMNDDSFKLLFSNENGTKTVMHPLHKWKSNNYWEQTKQMAIDVNNSGSNLAFLPEYEEKKSADAIVEFKKKLVIADFKYSSSSNWNTLSKELIKGFYQAETIVLKLDKMDSGNFRKAIEYIVNNKHKYGNVKLINKRGKVIDISWKDIRGGDYKKKIKGFL